jgi:hypothetical protein
MSLSSSDSVFQEHSRSVIKFSTNGMGSPFYLKPIVDYFQTEQQKTKRSKKKGETSIIDYEHAVAPFLHRSLSMIHPG